MAKRKRNTKRRRRRRGAKLFFTLLTFVLVTGAIIASLTVFLKVSDIEITGAAYYTNEQIIESSQIKKGDNLFGINKFAVRDRIVSQYPYVEDIRITRKLPDTFVFEVIERKPCGYIETDDCRWLIDCKGFLLERVDNEEEIQGAVITSGETLLTPFAGGEINWEHKEKLDCLTKILGALSDRGIIDKVHGVDVSAMYSLSFNYENRLNVVLGTSEDIEKKMNMFSAVLPQLAPTDRGVLNLSNTSEARFRPERIVKNEEQGS